MGDEREDTPFLLGHAYYMYTVRILTLNIMKTISLLLLLFASLTLVAQDITGKWYGYPDL